MKRKSALFLPLFGALFTALPLFSCGKGGDGPRKGSGQAASRPVPSAPGKNPSQAKAHGLPKKLIEGLPENMVKALEQGGREKRLVLVEVFDPECNFCRDMEEVLAEPVVQEAMKPFIYIKVGKDVKRLVEEFGLQMTPTFLVYKPDGTPMDYFPEGFRSGKVFVAELKNFENIFQGKPEIEIPEDDHPNYGKG